MKDDTDFAVSILKTTFGTNQYTFADDVLRGHIKIEADQRVTFWNISKEEELYLSYLATQAQLQRQESMRG